MASPQPHLFRPLSLRELIVDGRAWVSPMCQYSCDDQNAPGVVNDWHLVHLGAFALGGAPLILTEATAVQPEGRISPQDAGLWEDGAQQDAWVRVVDFVHEHGSLIGMQLAHSGRKGSSYAPFRAGNAPAPAGTLTVTGTVQQDAGGWQTVSSGSTPFGAYDPPRSLSVEEIGRVVQAFADTARRAVDAGFDTVEVHAAHGYLLHQFFSPLVNDRTDDYGGSDEGRIRLHLEVIEAVRAVIPDGMPLLLRVSATDWDPGVPGGIEGEVERVVALCRAAAERGVDLVDVSSGGNLAAPEIPLGPGYQTRFAEQIRREAGVPTSAVGLITHPHQAEHVLASGQADAVMLARVALADPRWWHRAAHALGHDLPWPGQYARVSDKRVY